MTKRSNAIACLLLLVATACGSAESNDPAGTKADGSDVGGAAGASVVGASGGTSGSGGAGPSSGGSPNGVNPAERFAGSWQPSNWVRSGTCEPPPDDDDPLVLVAETDGTVTLVAGTCMLPMSVSGDVAELPSVTSCGAGTYNSFRIELTGPDAATLTASGTIGAAPASCSAEVSATLTRVEQ